MRYRLRILPFALKENFTGLKSQFPEKKIACGMDCVDLTVSLIPLGNPGLAKLGFA